MQRLLSCSLRRQNLSVVHDSTWQFSRYFCSGFKTTTPLPESAAVTKGTGRTRRTSYAAQRQRSNQSSSLKGRRVSFHRMSRGPKRYLALLDSHLRHEKVNALVRVAHKALENGTFIDHYRSERIIDLLIEKSRMYDIESLVKWGKSDLFCVSLKSLLLVITPLLLSGRAFLIGQLLEDVDEKSLQLYYHTFKNSVHRAKLRRLRSNTRLSGSEIEGYLRINQILHKAYLKLQSSPNMYNDDMGTHSDDDDGEEEEASSSSSSNRKAMMMKLSSSLGGSNYHNVNNFYVEDRSFPGAPNLEFNDLTNILEKQDQDGMYLLFNSSLWPSKESYESRNEDIVQAQFRAKREKEQREQEGDLPSVIAITIGTPGHPNMASSLWKANENDFEEGDEHDDDEGDECESEENEQYDGEEDGEYEIDVNEILREVIQGEGWSIQGEGWDTHEYENDDEHDEQAHYDDEEGYRMLDPVFRTEGEGSSATRESAARDYAFKQMVHYYGCATTRVPPDYKDLTAAFEEMEKANGTFGTDKAVRFTSAWESYKNNLSNLKGSNSTEPVSLSSDFPSPISSSEYMKAAPIVPSDPGVPVVPVVPSKTEKLDKDDTDWPTE